MPVEMSSAVRSLGTVVLAAAILSPLTFRAGWDSFPLSSYPMFSRADLGRINELAHVVLVRRDGTTLPASPTMIGTSEPMTAKAIVRNHVTRGTASELCVATAARARETTTDVIAVEVVTSVFDTRRYWSTAPDARAPLERKVHARCEVPR